MTGRAFVIFRTSGPRPDFVLNARAFRMGPEYHEWARIRDIQDDALRRPE